MVATTYAKLLAEGKKIIKKQEFNNPDLDVMLILMHITGKDKIYFYTHGNEIADDEIQNKFFEMARLRDSGYPLQYMLKSQEFMGLDFYVDEGVLIPRPDTEILVESIIDQASKFDIKRPIKILDLCTGSGAIGLSLAHYIQNSIVYLVDISDKCLDIATKNMQNLGLSNVKIQKYDVLSDDIFEILKQGTDLNNDSDFEFSTDLNNYFDFENRFDIIVSNPPYIKTSVIDNLQTEVREYEPRLALDGGDDGLIFYERLAKICNGLINKHGMMSVEIGHDQREAVEELFKNIDGAVNVETKQDYSGLDRVVSVILNK